MMEKLRLGLGVLKHSCFDIKSSEKAEKIVIKYESVI